MLYQHDTYGVSLEILSFTQPSQDITIDTELETLEEIDKLIRQPPKHSRQGI